VVAKAWLNLTNPISFAVASERPIAEVKLRGELFLRLERLATTASGLLLKQAFTLEELDDILCHRLGRTARVNDAVMPYLRGAVVRPPPASVVPFEEYLYLFPAVRFVPLAWTGFCLSTIFYSSFPNIFVCWYALHKHNLSTTFLAILLKQIVYTV